MKLITLKDEFSICKVNDYSKVNLDNPFTFISTTSDEKSLVCKSCDVPSNTIAKEDNWRGFYIDGILDFSLIGILAKITDILANNQIGVFVVSTYNTDYVFVKSNNYQKALDLLKDNNYQID